MTVFIKLGGCNGSGKTSVARELIKLVSALPTRRKGDAKPTGYRGEVPGEDPFVPVWVMGRYETACGGMDAFPNKEIVRELWAHNMRKEGIVFGEGLIFGKTYGYIGETLMKNKVLLRDVETLWAFMGTPFDECVERVNARRAFAALQKGKEPTPFDPEKTMRMTYTIMERLEEGVRSGKYPINGEVLNLGYSPGRQPATDAKKLLKKALEMYHAHG